MTTKRWPSQTRAIRFAPVEAPSRTSTPDVLGPDGYTTRAVVAAAVSALEH
jgi:hypothetical protein